MKNHFITAISFIVFTSMAQAQHINLGVKGGLNVYTVKTQGQPSFSPTINYHVGLLTHIHLKPNLAFQPEVVYSVQGVHRKGEGSEDLKLNYVNVPLVLQYMFDNGFRIETGPQFGFMLSAKSKIDGATTDATSTYFTADLGICLGLSYVKPSTGFGYSIRYNQGFSNIKKPGNDYLYNQGLQVGVFYLFQHKS